EEPVTFTAEPEGSPTSYKWIFGDGQTAGPTGNPTASHTFAAAGVYNVQLEIRKEDAGCVAGVCKATIGKLVTVAAKPRDGTCVDSQTTLCVLNGRFELSIIWRTDDPDAPGSSLNGRARVVDGQTEEAGLFWFFGPDNWEMMAKVLNGCAVNDYFWVFAASTTDVGFTLIVTDTKTGLVKTYVNPDGVAANAITDTEAFSVCAP
ncbi:MAG: PKD domain-containing protein, partial [Actinobacteria bacterium]|nr:PKD domain-containing protein [Actinomycetota bacterium]